MAAPANLLLAAACEVLPEGWRWVSSDVCARLILSDNTMQHMMVDYGRCEWSVVARDFVPAREGDQYSAWLNKVPIGWFPSLQEAIAAVELAYCGCRVRRG